MIKMKCVCVLNSEYKISSKVTNKKLEKRMSKFEALKESVVCGKACPTNSLDAKKLIRCGEHVES